MVIGILAISSLVLLLTWATYGGDTGDIAKAFATQTERVVMVAMSRAKGRILLLTLSIVVPLIALLFSIHPTALVEAPSTTNGILSMLVITVPTATYIVLYVKLADKLVDALFDSSYAILLRDKQKKEKKEADRLAGEQGYIDYMKEKEERIKELSK